MKRVLPLVLLLLCVTLARADELQDQMNALQTAITAESESIRAQLDKLKPGTQNDTPGTPTPEEVIQRTQAQNVERQKLRDREQMIEMFRSGLVQMSVGRGRDSDAYLNEVRESLSRIPDLNPKLRAQALAFLDKFRELQQKRVDDYQKQVDQALKRARASVDSATDADALNGIVGELGALSQAQWSSDSPFGRQIQGQLTAAVNALTAWQSYLRNYQAGYFTAAMRDLRELLTNSSQYPFFAADRIRTEMNKIDDQASAQSKQILAILGAVKQVSDIPAAAARLTAFNAPADQENYAQSSGRQAVIERMQIYAAQCAAIQYGGNQRDGYSGYVIASNPATPELLRIENLVRLYALTNAFSTLGVAAPEPNENSKAYLTRIVSTAAKAKNWELVARLLELSKESAGLPDGVTEDQLPPIKTFLSARHLEAAGQYASAILAYRTVIINPGNLLPIDEVAAHLKQLSEDHKDILPEVAAQETRQQESMRNQQMQMQQMQQMQIQQMQRMQQMQGMPPGMPIQQGAAPRQETPPQQPLSSPAATPEPKTP